CTAADTTEERSGLDRELRLNSCQNLSPRYFSSNAVLADQELVVVGRGSRRRQLINRGHAARRLSGGIRNPVWTAADCWIGAGVPLWQGVRSEPGCRSGRSA